MASESDEQASCAVCGRVYRIRRRPPGIGTGTVEFWPCRNPERPDCPGEIEAAEEPQEWEPPLAPPPPRV